MSTVKKDKRIVVSLDDCSSTSCYSIKKIKAASTSAAASFGRVVPTIAFNNVHFDDFVPSNFLEGLKEPGPFNSFTSFRFTRAGTYSLRLTLVPDSFIVQPTHGLITLSITRGNIITNIGLTTSRDGYSPYVATISLRIDAGNSISFHASGENALIVLYDVPSGFIVTKLDTQPGPSTLQPLLDAAARKETASTSNVSVAKPPESKIDEITSATKKPEVPAEPSKQTALNIKCLKH